MTGMGLTVDLTPFLPELMLTGGFLLLLILNLVFRTRRGIVTATGGTLLLGIVAAATLAGDESIGPYLFGSVTQDGITVFFRLFFCAATAISLGLLVFRYPDDGEPYLLVLSGVLGMLLLAGANDLVTLFVALELVSIPSYVLAGYKRDDVRSGEASIKYVLYGAMSSGLMVYGFSLLYGITGTTSLSELATRLAFAAGQDTLVLVGLALVLAGIGYKIAMVPLHFWCPDVYEGSPTAVTAFFSVVPKAAGFAALYRLMPVFAALDTSFGFTAVGLISAVSALTMTFGNLGAIWQTSVKRMLAYSSIAHAGYLLMGFAVLAGEPSLDLHQDAGLAILFYLTAYLFMNLGAFFVVEMVERLTGGETLSHFRGLGRRAALPAMLMVIFLFSLTGIPPFAGFIGKFLLFAVLVKSKMFALAIIGIANTVVSLYYYVRIVREMYIVDSTESTDEPAPKQPRFSTLGAVVSFATVAPTLVFGLWWGPLAEWIRLRIW